MTKEKPMKKSVFIVILGDHRPARFWDYIEFKTKKKAINYAKEIAEKRHKASHLRVTKPVEYFLPPIKEIKKEQQ